jgi:hypothetical protein
MFSLTKKGKLLMADLEIFRINENGAGWVSLENATTSEKLDLELAILTKAEVKMLCFKCHVEIPRGNVCVNHKNVKGAIYFAD